MVGRRRQTLWLSKVFATSARRILIHHHRADAFAGVHQIKTFVDVLQLQHMGNHAVDFDFAVHIPIDDFWHIGATACATEGCAFPDPAGDELEGAGLNDCASRGDADDDGLTPAAVGAF